jgi:integrase
MPQVTAVDRQFGTHTLARPATTSPTVPGQSVEQRGGPAIPGVHERDPLYAGYMLILVLGLPKSEALGLAWDEVDLDGEELSIGHQLQRVSRQLLHRGAKTSTSDAAVAAAGHLRSRAEARGIEGADAGKKARSAWQCASGGAYRPVDFRKYH